MAEVIKPVTCKCKYVYVILGFDCQQDTDWFQWNARWFNASFEIGGYRNLHLAGVFCHPSLVTTTTTIITKRVCINPSKDDPFATQITKTVTDVLAKDPLCDNVLLIGFSYGGLIASIVGGVIAGNKDIKDKLRVVTLGSIYTPTIASFDILHIINYGDIAFSCNGLPMRPDTTHEYYDKERQVLYTVPTITNIASAGMSPFKSKAWKIHNDYFKYIYDQYDPRIKFHFDFLIRFANDLPFIDPMRSRLNQPFIVDPMPHRFSNSNSNNEEAREIKKQQAELLVNLPKLPSSLWFGRNTHKKSYYRTIKPLVIQKLANKLSENNVDNVRIQGYLQMPEFLEFLINLLRFLRKYHDIDESIDDNAAAEIANAFFLEGAFTVKVNGSPLLVDPVSKLISLIKDRLLTIADTILKRDPAILKPAILQIIVDYVIDLLTMLTTWRTRWPIDKFSFKKADIDKLEAIYAVLYLKQRNNLQTAIHKFTEAMTKTTSHNVVTDRRNSNINTISPKPNDLNKLRGTAPWIANFGGSRRKLHKRKRKTQKRR